jgi:hypothetical protein
VSVPVPPDAFARGPSATSVDGPRMGAFGPEAEAPVKSDSPARIAGLQSSSGLDGSDTAQEWSTRRGPVPHERKLDYSPRLTVPWASVASRAELPGAWRLASLPPGALACCSSSMQAWFRSTRSQPEPG